MPDEPCGELPVASPPEPPAEKWVSWLVGPIGDADLRELLTRFEADPNTQVTRIRGKPDAPSRLVVEMSRTTQARYQAEFGDRFLFEENRPLQLLRREADRPDAATLGQERRKGETKMAAKKDQPENEAENNRHNADAGDANQTPSEEAPRARRTSGGRRRTAPAPEQRRQEYLVSHTRAPLPASVLPLDLQMIEQGMKEGIPGIEFRRTIGPPPGHEQLGVLAAVPSQSRNILVAAMDEAQADALRQQPQLLVEPNLPLHLPQTPGPAPLPPQPAIAPNVFHPLATGFQVTIRVLGASGEALAGAEVYVYGFWQSAGVTNANGEVQLSLFAETPQSISAVYVKPKADHWDRWVPRPALPAGGTYDVTLRPLDQWFPNFPNQQVADWGYEAMRFNELTPANQYTGAGIKVAIIDSGAASATHQDLTGQAQSGFDTVAGSNQGWDNDTLSHGTHCAGVIAGLDNNRGIRGIVPQAQLFIYKIFPGGDFDHLIDALDHCIEAGVDVVNLSLGADGGSTFVEERLLAAKNQGIACIVAAGNSSGPIQFPAVSPHVLAVTAIGRRDTFPADSYHNLQINGTPDTNGYFSAKFTCFGPQAGVAAPGVAILSSVPPDNYAVWDGTSMAGPHVAGLAALLLAHHPDFKQPPFDQRNSQRVDRLFRIIKETAQPLSLGGRDRTGAGLPDAVRAFTQALGAAPATPTAANGVMSQQIQQLLAIWP